jgi:DNA polymerase
MEPWTREWRRNELKRLYQAWADCENCELSKKRKNVVFGNGDCMASMMFVGQAPGEVEDDCGEPFAGPSGELFDTLLQAAGIDRKEVFTTNLVMCFPPENRIPTKDERLACLDRLHRQIYVVDPMMIVPVGKVAMTALMGGAYKSIEEDHGKIGVAKVPGKHADIEYAAMPIFHPSYILREDRIDPKTKSWAEGGPAHYTVKDLARAKQIVKFLKKSYEQAREASAKR